MKITASEIALDVKRALEEDIRSGDVSAALLPEELIVEASIITREPMFVAGIAWVNEIFNQVDPTILISWQVAEGSWQAKPTILCTLKGSARCILTAERTALNFLQTLAATATETWRYLEKLKGLNTQLLDTRKTLPGLRLAQKYAVACAGGVNHRVGLYDAFLIKENHIKACGSITKAIDKARRMHADLFLEVEVETLTELEEALRAKPDRILLDNFSLEHLSQAVLLAQPFGIKLEASGNVNLETIVTIAKTGVDYISVGSLTKSVQAIDLSLLII